MGMSEPRYHAAVSDHAAMLQYLLTARAEILKANDPNQTPMLHAAAGRGTLDGIYEPQGLALDLFVFFFFELLGSMSRARLQRSNTHMGRCRYHASLYNLTRHDDSDLFLLVYPVEPSLGPCLMSHLDPKWFVCSTLPTCLATLTPGLHPWFRPLNVLGPFWLRLRSWTLAK